MPQFKPAHIPALFIGTAFTFGGMMPFWNPSGAIREFGLPERIAVSPTAQTCFAIYGSRVTMIGMAMWTFYLQGKIDTLDTILALIGYFGAVDGYMCWREGVPKQAIWRAFCATLLSGWGALRLTERWS